MIVVDRRDLRRNTACAAPATARTASSDASRRQRSAAGAAGSAGRARPARRANSTARPSAATIAKRVGVRASADDRHVAQQRPRPGHVGVDAGDVHERARAPAARSPTVSGHQARRAKPARHTASDDHASATRLSAAVYSTNTVGAASCADRRAASARADGSGWARRRRAGRRRAGCCASRSAALTKRPSSSRSPSRTAPATAAPAQASPPAIDRARRRGGLGSVTRRHVRAAARSPRGRATSTVSSSTGV